METVECFRIKTAEIVKIGVLIDKNSKGAVWQKYIASMKFFYKSSITEKSTVVMSPFHWVSLRNLHKHVVTGIAL